MATVNDSSLLIEIKKRLGIAGDYQNDLLSAYAKDVKNYLQSAGISTEIVNDDVAVGVISRGVADMWNLGAGEGKLSELFYQRVTQLVWEQVEDV